MSLRPFLLAVPACALPACALIGAAHAQFIPSTALNPVVIGPQSPRFTDVDGDGLSDFVFVEANPGRISWARKAGPGQFETHVTLLPAPSLVRAPRFGDVDGDGGEDLVFSNSLRQVLLQRHSAAGFVGLPVPLFVAATLVRDLHLADADGDQDLDLFVASHGGNISSAGLVEVYLNDGHGAFTLGTSIMAPPNSGFLEVRVADLDGDGAVELVGVGGGAVVLYSNDGAGVFAAPTVIDVPSPPQPWHVELADLDGDQDVDVLVSVTGGAPLRAYLNDGAGVFGPAQLRSTTLGLVNQFRVADVDRDGLPDIVTTTNLGLELFLGLGGGAFASAIAPTSDPSVRPYEFLLEDVDGDAAPDLVVAIVGGNAAVGWVPNTTAAGGDAFGALVPLSAVGSTYLTVEACDLDGDGRDEVVAGRGGVASPLVVFDRLPSGAFQASYSAPPGIPGIDRVTRGFVDTDGLEDHFVLDDLGRVHTLRSASGGGFAAPTLAAQLFAGAPFQVGDLDGDGDADLVGAPSPNELACFENLGALGFSAARPLFTGNQQVGAIQLADLDGDLDVDIAVALRTDVVTLAPARIEWLPNLGGGFGPAVLVDAGTTDGRTLCAADFDGDARPDLLWSAPIDYPLGWSQNLGGGAFASAATLLQSSIQTMQISTVDVELDGDLDVILVDSFGSVRIWLQDAAGTLGGPMNPGVTATQVWAFASGDVDGDGDRDLLFSDRTNAEVELFESFAGARIGVSFCGPAVANSSGSSGLIEANGSLVVAANDVRLRASQLPGASVGFFLASRAFAVTFPVPGSQGRLCLGSPIGRFVGPGEVRFTGIERQMVLRIDLTRLPAPTGPSPAIAGETWGFQTWFRDVQPGGGATSNFTDVVALTLQ